MKPLAVDLTWIVPARLAIGGAPRQGGGLDEIRNQGVTLLVRMADEASSKVKSSDVKRAGLREVYAPIPDWTAPTQDRLKRLVAAVEEEWQAGGAVAITCLGGYGRSGTVAACLLTRSGKSPDDALANLIALRPGVREILSNEDQLEAIRRFAATQPTLGGMET